MRRYPKFDAHQHYRDECAREFLHTLALTPEQLDMFTVKIREEGVRLYRDFSWRQTRDPYAIWISEVMLQQTQVSRVARRYDMWLEKFPTLESLAAASRADVLEAWQGLGYNRRALSLKAASEQISEKYQGIFPNQADELLKLPGIGPATAAGICAFAFNFPATYLETNVRTVILHELLAEYDEVSDGLVGALVSLTCPVEEVRSWYYAMLDYGAYLKAQLPNPSRRSKHHVVQSVFRGSRRQKRAFLLREVLAQAHGSDDAIGFEELYLRLQAFEQAEQIELSAEESCSSILSDLVKEGFIKTCQKEGFSAYFA